MGVIDSHKMNHHSKDKETTSVSYVVIAIVAALAVLGVVAITLVTIPMQIQQAEAAGCPPNSPAFNASKGRCGANH